MSRSRRRLAGAVSLGLTAVLTAGLAAPVAAAPATDQEAAAPTAPAASALASISGAGTPAAESTGPAFHRLATVPAYLNTDRAETTVAEISTVTPDGNTVVYTDAEAGGIGFMDITDPAAPKPTGFLEVQGSPTSAYGTDDYLLVVVDTSESFDDPTGKMVLVDYETREAVSEVFFDGQPDSIDVTPDGATAFIALENQRDEDAGDGGLPQEPAGTLAMIPLGGAPEDVYAEIIHLVNLEGLDTPMDPEPEYVKVSPDGSKVALTLQENNGVVILDAENGDILNHFSAGSVGLQGVDTAEDGNLSLIGSFTEVPREPDAIGWIDDEHVATANEGDWKGGTRGWTVFDAATGEVAWDAGTSFEDLAHRYGQYPEHRSENKGTEPEGLAVATYGDTRYAFVGSERGNFVGVYDVTDPAAPVFQQLLPSTNGPEGLLVIPERDLLVVSSEVDDAENQVRATVQVYQLGEGAASSPTLKSADQPGASRADQPITWSALSALSAVPGEDDQVYAAPDSSLSPSRIYTVDTATQDDGGPATITDELVLEHGYDLEGLWADEDGTFWLAVEGVAAKAGGSTGNRLVHIGADGAELASVDLPAEVASGLKGQGFEGVTGVGSGQDAVLYAAVQRASANDPAGVARIGKYTVATGTWEWFGYQLDTTQVSGDWIGLSEITAVDEDTFALIERDKLAGPDAAVKKVTEVNLPEQGAATGEALVMVDKREAVDVLPRLRELNGWTQEKLEGLTIAGNGDVYAVTDNDGVEDATGETVFLDLGAAEDVFENADAPEPEPIKDFVDNAPGTIYYSSVRWMQLAGITKGYVDGTYRKHADITRGESVAFIHRCLKPGAVQGGREFRDVPAGHTFREAITWASAAGVTNGYADGNFRPSQDVTRGEFAAFLYRAVKPDYTGPENTQFRDVPAGHTHRKAIEWMASTGISTGYRDGTFQPEREISRGEVAVLMHRYDAMVKQMEQGGPAVAPEV